MCEAPVHIVHLVHRFEIGGMENGLVNLVNRLPGERYRHTIVALTESGRIASRISNPDVHIEALHLPPGPLALKLPRLWRTFRRLKPAVVHTRNVGTLEAQLAAWAARVPVRVHGEHGWEVHDLIGSSRSLARTRRALRRFVHAQVALSAPTREYLRERIGVPPAQLHSICNGVDTGRFHPGERADAQSDVRDGQITYPESPIVVGYVGRLADVKNPLLLVAAFEQLHRKLEPVDQNLTQRLRLRFVGDGPLLPALQARVEKSPQKAAIEILGNRNDIPTCLRALDIYALPSLAEGISNTLLEAMASGLPCVATAVGGNGEMIRNGHDGLLVVPDDAAAMASALARYAGDPGLRAQHGVAARRRAVERFGIERMVAAYDALYAGLLAQKGLVSLLRLAETSETSEGSDSCAA